jgi:hypothetical protein
MEKERQNPKVKNRLSIVTVPVLTGERAMDQALWQLSLLLAEIARDRNEEPGSHVVEEIENGF